MQDSIGDNIKTYTESVGGGVDLSVQSTDAGPNVQKVQAGVQAGNPFDLADDIGGGPQQLITLGALTDVTDLTKQFTDAYGALMPIIPPGLQQNGKYWAIPFFSSSDAWFVRKDWMAAKGIDPASIDTYEKARDAALAISDPSKNQFGWGFSPYAVGDGPQLITHVVHSYGGSIQDKTGTKVVWNSPETVAGITFLADIYTNSKYKNMLPTGYESWDGSGNNNGVAERHGRHDRERLHALREVEGRQEPRLRQDLCADAPEGAGGEGAADRWATRLLLHPEGCEERRPRDRDGRST